MADQDEIVELRARLDQLDARQEHIEQLLLSIAARLPPEPAPPAPAQPKPRPGWVVPGAPSDPNNVGANYTGAPSHSEVATHGPNWVKKHGDGTVTIAGQGFGVRHDSDGRAIMPGPPEPGPLPHAQARPIGPERDPQHQRNVEILDRMME